MGLSKILTLFSALAIVVSKASATIKLPELITKQDISHIRFISNDGKFTYFTKRSGSLILGTNYTVKEVLGGKLGTNYTIYSSAKRDRLLILKNDNYHTFFSTRYLGEIYVIKFGGNKAKRLEDGIAPQLHLNDNWMSSYNPYKNTILFQKTRTPQIQFRIKIGNKLNPYFIPEIVMINKNTVIYSDINDKGFPGIIKYTRHDNQLKAIYKVPTINKKIELCSRKGQLIVGEFGLDNGEPHSTVFSIPQRTLDMRERVTLYESKKNDIGNMICSVPGDDIFFVKRVVEPLKNDRHEVAKLDVKLNKLEIISNLSNVGQIVNMDSKLIVPYQGKYYVLVGKSRVHENDLLQLNDSTKGN